MASAVPGARHRRHAGTCGRRDQRERTGSTGSAHVAPHEWQPDARARGSPATCCWSPAAGTRPCTCSARPAGSFGTTRDRRVRARRRTRRRPGRRLGTGRVHARRMPCRRHGRGAAEALGRRWRIPAPAVRAAGSRRAAARPVRAWCCGRCRTRAKHDRAASSSTCSATPPSPTSCGPPAPGCARSSTSSATRRSAPPTTRARRPACWPPASSPRRSAWTWRSSARRPSGRPTCRSPSRRWPAATAASCYDPVRVTALHAVARRARRAVRERRPVEAAVVLPAADGEDMETAVLRECRAARDGVGIDGRLDARQDRRAGPRRGRASSTGSTRT